MATRAVARCSEIDWTMFHKSLGAALLALSLAAGTAAVAKDDAPASSAAAATPAKPLSAGQSAARARQKTCGAEWKALTKEQKAAQGPKWPQYWSQCNKRLKGNDKA